MLDNGLIPCTVRFRKYVHEMLGNQFNVKTLATIKIYIYNKYFNKDIC